MVKKPRELELRTLRHWMVVWAGSGDFFPGNALARRFHRSTRLPGVTDFEVGDAFCGSVLRQMD